jgi:hypothetical protein
VTERQKLGAKLNPPLKAWIDSVIVPGLVRAYVGRSQKSDSLKLRVVPNSAVPKSSAEVSQ